MKREVKTINLTDAEMDKPLYRIFPLWFFEQALIVNGGCLTLVRPSAWEDPLEDPCSLIMMSAEGSQKHLQDYLQPTYAQCWSMEAQSDSLMRAYSRVSKDAVIGRNTEPRFEGVKAKTTVRKVIEALERFLNRREDASLEFFVGKIIYDENPMQRTAHRLLEIGPTQIGSGYERARSLTIKRKAFEHEQEVRIIAVAKNPFDPVLTVDVDLNALFEEVSFDPRLSTFERIERRKRVESLGYSGTISENYTYQRVLAVVPVPKGFWDR